MSSTQAGGMRLRPRLSLDNHANTTQPSNTTRRKNALRDLSNNKGANNANSKKGNDIAKRPRTRSSMGRAGQAQIQIAEDEPQKQRPRTRTSLSRQAKIVLEDDSSSNAKPAARRQSARVKAKIAQQKKETAKAKKEAAKKLAQEKKAAKRRRSAASEARSMPPAKKMRTAANVSKVTMRQINREAKSRLVNSIENEGDYLVHPEYRLQRASFDGKNHTLGIPKHDQFQRNDVLRNTAYATDMLQQLYAAETKTRPKQYVDQQNDINAKMRAILIDWLVEVHMKFRLVPETLYLCVNIIDRYCSVQEVRRSQLQLVGVTALFLACKYEEIYPPEVRDCVYITDRAYTNEEVLDMEQDIVAKLQFCFTVPTAYPFLQRFFTLVRASDLVKHAASYYNERTLQEHEMLQYRPSEICAASVVLALNHPEIAEEDGRDLNTKKAFIPAILLEYTGFDKKRIYQIAKIIAGKVAEEPITASNRELIAVKKKYDNRKYSYISTEYDLPSMPRSL